MDNTNTALERLAINSGVNLSDAHARAPLGPVGAQSVANLDRLFDEASRMAQYSAEGELVGAFERLGGVHFPRAPQISYSSSSLVIVIANYLRRVNCRVHILDPCFDNIRDLLVTAGLSVDAISESAVLDSSNRLQQMGRGDVLWLTAPSNPTGWVLDAREYSRVAGTCADNGVLLVVDHCFRFFSPTTSSFDQYEILERSAGLEYITIEDTGKTTSLLDLKVGLLVASASLELPLRLLNEEVLLNVSPFACVVIARALDALAAGDLEHHLRPLLSASRVVSPAPSRRYSVTVGTAKMVKRFPSCGSTLGDSTAGSNFRHFFVSVASMCCQAVDSSRDLEMVMHSYEHR